MLEIIRGSHREPLPGIFTALVAALALSALGVGPVLAAGEDPVPILSTTR